MRMRVVMQMLVFESALINHVTTISEVTGKLKGGAHCAQPKHPTKHHLLPPRHLQPPKHRHRHDHHHYIQQKIENPNIQIQALLIPTRAPRYLRIPIKRYRPANQTSSNNDCDEEGKVDTVGDVDAMRKERVRKIRI